MLKKINISLRKKNSQMILSPKQAEAYIEFQKQAYKYLKAVRYPVNKIAKHMQVSRQTAKKRFETQSWQPKDYLKIINLINSKI